jgi:hypothetical protein
MPNALGFFLVLGDSRLSVSFSQNELLSGSISKVPDAPAARLCIWLCVRIGDLFCVAGRLVLAPDTLASKISSNMLEFGDGICLSVDFFGWVLPNALSGDGLLTKGLAVLSLAMMAILRRRRRSTRSAYSGRLARLDLHGAGDKRDGPAIETSMLTVFAVVGELVSAIHLVAGSGFFDELSTESGMLARQRNPVTPPDQTAPLLATAGSMGVQTRLILLC